jgi:prepilin-type N-terminal cleavage/methylation domain-containing protein
MNSRIEELRGVAMNLSMKSKGFSMVEVLIAMLILAISLLALAGLMMTTTRNSSFGGHMTEASTFAQDKLEQLRVSPWAGIITGTDTITTAIPGVPGTGIVYTRNWTVTPNTNGDQRWVSITITWTDPTKNSNHSMRLLSVVTE